ncbi:hypothetical protein KCV87_09955 [Actinosynnema pretiosum subsp. pretiosum]|uniref:Uncharacterized protein n=1 Tax=Actinosynnema pretiosum subsp. pretiosum TaxID=103721 RepID=A0AA45L9V9_9PSEU|nr:hypothetical protein APASM_2045 [Actinosynnema pretiosum subsp. pretiosum]QUF06344.1 hypothetical protein KCV87_09955 [Actinosynnema pretiosum subsp. pretiosum]
MLTITTCLVVSCDTCCVVLTDPDSEGTLHFTDEAQALAWLRAEGWHVIGDGRGLSCRDCVARRECSRSGHVFTTWFDCLCGPAREHCADPVNGCGRSYSWCERCGKQTTRTPEQEVA